MYCSFCGKAAKSKTCATCVGKLKYYRDKLETPGFDVETSKRCQEVIKQIEWNQVHGGYVPPFHDAVFMPHECQQCGGYYMRCSNTRICIRCRQMNEKFSSYVSMGRNPETSNAMRLLCEAYIRYQEEGRQLPLVWERFTQSGNYILKAKP